MFNTQPINVPSLPYTPLMPKWMILTEVAVVAAAVAAATEHNATAQSGHGVRMELVLTDKSLEADLLMSLQAAPNSVLLQLKQSTAPPVVAVVAAMVQHIATVQFQRGVSLLLASTEPNKDFVM
jgi:hypothetical protein